MRKFLLLLCSLVLFTFSSKAQKDTIFFETFDLPSGPDSVFTGSIGSPPITWNDTNNLYRSPFQSYHLKPSKNPNVSQTPEVWFVTDTFSTVGNPYVFLEFKHIAKLYLNNSALIDISIDGGVNWITQIPASYYKGSSVGPNTYANQLRWNEASFVGISGDLWQFNVNSIPNSTWWSTERFDLSGLASNLTTQTGYPYVQLRFRAQLPTSASFRAGWWVDDVLVTASPCELEPPKFDFNIATGANCFPPKPEQGLVANPGNTYDVASIVTDAGGNNTGIDSISLYYSINRAPFQRVTMSSFPPTPDRYKGSIAGPVKGDTVRWYIVAEDIGCPTINLNNDARTPDMLYNTAPSVLTDSATYSGFYTFWIDSALPSKCGTPYCGAYPTLIQTFPIIIDFENSQIFGGTGPGIIRGVRTYAATPPAYWRNDGIGSGWTIQTGPTPGSPFTGPTGNHTPGGSKYAYLEANGLSGDGRLETPCIDLRNAPGCLGLEFYYHMYGSDIDEFRIEIDTGTGSDINDFHKEYKVIKNQQQLNQNDPWQRGVISLEPFIGQIIRLRFRGYAGKGQYGDIAIDDIKIFQPDLVDMIVTSNNEPKNGYCDYSTIPVEISLVNNGCTTIDTIPVAYQVNNQAVVWDTVYRSLKLGDTATFSFGTLPNISAVGTPHQVRTWANAMGDVDRSNDTAMGPQITPVQPINTFPFFEDFEGGTFLTQNLGNSNWIFTNGVAPNFRWQVGREMTQTRNTGPFIGYHHEGQYLYAASNSTSGAASTYFRSKCIDLTGFSTTNNDQVVMDFFYHGYGSNINRLEIEVSRGDEDLNTWTTLPTATITQAQAPQTSELSRWELKRVNLSNYIGDNIKIRFKASRTGAGNQTDFAIDEIRIFKLLANDAGGYSIEKPGGRASQAGPKSNTQVAIVNYGFNVLQSCSVHFKVTPLCGQAPAQTYSQHFINLGLQPGENDVVVMNTAGIVYPAGEYRVNAFTSNINGTSSTNGDTYPWNDTISRNIIGTTIYDIPFANNFDPCNYEMYGTYPSNGLLQWELGTPSNSGNITTPRSSPNAWVTNLDGPFLTDTREELVMPIFDEFDTVFRAELRFYQNIDFGTGGGSTNPDVAGSVLYRHQGAFKVLGEDIISSNLGINWLGSCIGSPSVQLFGGKPAFVISTTPKPNCLTSSAVNGWIYTMFPLYEFDGDSLSLLEMKFEFASKPSAAPAGGWGIDDFEIYIPPQNSASPVDVRTVSPLPFPGKDQYLAITIENTGAKVLDSCNVEVFIDGQQLLPLNYTHVFPVGKMSYLTRSTFDSIFVWPAVDVTSGAHEVCVYTSRPNGKSDALPADDSLCKTISVIKEIDLTSIGEFKYCDGFEDPSDYGWFSLNSKDYSSNTSWEEGAPVQFSGAHGGSNVWMTDLDANYGDADASALFTPIFIVDSGQVYEINFWHQLESERYHDGGNVEYTIDGGVTWYPIGYADTDWYSDPFVTSLDQIRGGWTDTTGGWIEAKRRISFLKDTKTILRFRFGSDYDIYGAGWAIDDFCLSKDTTGLGAKDVIGTGEYHMPEQTIIGHLAPNPASHSSQLAFYFPEPKVMNVKVFNVLGQQVQAFEKKYQEGMNSMTFETSRWESGIYIISLEYEGNATTRKLIISN